jgi:3',5'-cyclic-AMP phosphodiesterase
MAYVMAQISDIHIGGPNLGSGDRFSMAVDEINAMTRPPDLVLLTGDVTDNGSTEEWDELCQRANQLTVPWTAIPGNHDRKVAALAGHRAIDAGPLRLVLLDTSSDVFTEEDATWLENELSAHTDRPTVIAIHQPPFETGIWWMDCVGLNGIELVEGVVRRHPQVIKVLSGHVHRLMQSNWGSCSLWACPSTSVSVAADMDPSHSPAETAEGPSFSLHAYTGSAMVSYLMPVGPAAKRKLIEEVAPDFVKWARDVQAKRTSTFS